MTHQHSPRALNRRAFLSLGLGSLAVLGAGTLDASGLAGCPSTPAGEPQAPVAAESPSEARDLAILYLALGLEYQAIFAYNFAARSGLLSTANAQVGVAFRDNHHQHAAALAGALTQVTPRMLGAVGTILVDEVTHAQFLRVRAPLPASQPTPGFSGINKLT